MSASPITSTAQYLRYCQLLIIDQSGAALDVSKFRIKFSVKYSDNQTPNICDVKIYNLSPATIASIKSSVNTKSIVLSAGYQGNYGVIFQGDIKQAISGRESAVDTFLELQAGDSEMAYNFAIVNTTLGSGASAKDQLNASLNGMAAHGVTAGVTIDPTTTKLPRGKVMFGASKDYLRTQANATGQSWNIQQGKLNYIPRNSIPPGTAIVLTSKTGMIGTPQQTSQGINMKCLLNPKMKVNGRVQLDNKSVADYKIDLATPNSAANIPPAYNLDGIYYIFIVEHSGDNRGVEWYTNLICLSVDTMTNPINSVQVSYGF